MSDHEVSVHYRRTVVLRDGQPVVGEGQVDCGIEIKSTYPIEETVHEIIEKSQQQFQEIKALLYTELGLKFNVDPETSAVVEMFPGAVPVAEFPSEPMAVVQDPSIVAPAGPAQQAAAAHLGNVVVPITGEPDLQDGTLGVPLPDPNDLKDWVDQCWWSLLTNPDEWVDNRMVKDAEMDNDHIPHFYARDAGRFPEKGVLGATRPQGLYLSSKFGPAPAWALANLHLVRTWTNP